MYGLVLHWSAAQLKVIANVPPNELYQMSPNFYTLSPTPQNVSMTSRPSPPEQLKINTFYIKFS
jgi:hypothetical protein